MLAFHIHSSRQLEMVMAIISLHILSLD